MIETADADRSANPINDDWNDRDHRDPPPLTADEFWARIEAPLR
ncbi:hypothetical protein [Sphingomonas sp. DBB INV C78]